MPGEYAPDESTAEKARGNPAGHANGQTDPLSNIEGSPNGDLRAVGEHNAIEELDFRPDAKVWHLYLVEAEREAKERAELWRTGLDAVLIFAGLFAGIVSAFVIDVRKDLEADSEQRLLTSIELILSEQQPLPKRIPAISIATSALWNISLYITLFAATMGASAKAWLATFVSVNTPHEAKGAFHRYRLDQHAERWCLREVIASAPLLVQLALGLFLVGLLLQNFVDNWILGVLLLLFFVSGGILYLLLTIHPWGTPSSPYNTAISDPLMWVALGLPSRGKKNPPDVEMDINKGLADILYTRLLKSPNPAFVDEAIAEVALAGFKQKWINYLCRNDTPLVVLRRLRQRVAVRPTASDRNSNSFCNILLVLLRFLEHYEVETTSLLAGDRNHTGGEFKMFKDALCQLSPSDNPLALLHDISEDVDVLLLSLCIHLDCRNPRLRPPEYSDRRRLPRWRGLRLDTTATNDWASNVTHLKIAACRAIVTGNDQHKVLSTRLLVSWLVSGAPFSTSSARIPHRRFTRDDPHMARG
ncbi:hypothetical protein FA13DRAFT_511499 [Coprinellus micaceus]|uniref:DUF6535 domain-containing protein n=1 Tax=Coprinellus micaceus TaxID=71717 RepID=A0A4Y7SBE0_COPMI|nr:hypothetical protein FA13DRAFT_511499 [Coprinellus micaceus]